MMDLAGKHNLAGTCDNTPGYQNSGFEGQKGEPQNLPRKPTVRSNPPCDTLFMWVDEDGCQGGVARSWIGLWPFDGGSDGDQSSSIWYREAPGRETDDVFGAVWRFLFQFVGLRKEGRKEGRRRKRVHATFAFFVLRFSLQLYTS
ncbi:unnamed protein product [Sphagnum balticum]